MRSSEKIKKNKTKNYTKNYTKKYKIILFLSVGRFIWLNVLSLISHMHIQVQMNVSNLSQQWTSSVSSVIMFSLVFSKTGCSLSLSLHSAFLHHLPCVFTRIPPSPTPLLISLLQLLCSTLLQLVGQILETYLLYAFDRRAERCGVILNVRE